MTLLLVYVGVALGFSFLCSVLEAVLLSCTPAYIATLEEAGRPVGATLKRLKDQVDRPLAAILTLNTVAHTVGAAGAGAQAQQLWGSEVLAVASAILTLLILFLSEIIPKTLGALYWRQLAPLAARVLPLLIWVLYPLVWVAEILARTLSGNKVRKGVISPQEISAMARLGEEAGTVEESETRIVRNLFRLGSVRTTDIMTPRTVLFSLDAALTIKEALSKNPVLSFSRIPVWEETTDNVVGYVRRDALLLHATRGGDDRAVGELKIELLVLPGTLPVSRLFERLMDEREQIALVINEFGSVSGVVTLEDVVETLLGVEIVDEVDPVADMRALARQRWQEMAARSGITIDDKDASAPGRRGHDHDA